MAEEDNKIFFSQNNNYDDFVMYVLYRLFDYCSSEVTKQKLITCLVLEGAITSKLQSIETWKNDCSVKFNIPAEENDHLTSSTKSSDFIISGLTNKSNPYEVSTNISTNQSVGLKISETFKDEEVKNEKAPTESSSI